MIVIARRVPGMILRPILFSRLTQVEYQQWFTDRSSFAIALGSETCVASAGSTCALMPQQPVAFRGEWSILPHADVR
jgi:hypothetical protein